MLNQENKSSRKRKPLPDVGKASVAYKLVYWLVNLYYHVYYRKFTVVGRENIPANKPLIFAGNHQNALMDALSILFAARGKVAFLARADLFKKKHIARILYFFRILPVYRIRDGISEMSQNDASFQKAAELLRNGTPLALFPEGNHSGFKRLRSLKKGICRIAFMAEEKSGFTLDLHIVPTGIDYSNYSDPGTRLLIKYGKPIRIADYTAQYKENPQKALGALRDKLSEALEPLMINISTEDDYSTYMDICQHFRLQALNLRKQKNTHPNRLEAEREIIRLLDQNVPLKRDVFESIKKDNHLYQELLMKYKLRAWLIEQNRNRPFIVLLNTLLSILLLPIHLYGLLLNYLPYKIPPYLTRNVEDHVFHSSLHFGIGLLLFPVYHLLLLILFSIFTKGLLIKVLFALSLPVSGIFTFYYYKHLLKLRGRLRLLVLRITNKSGWSDLLDRHNQLINKIKDLIYFN